MHLFIHVVDFFFLMNGKISLSEVGIAQNTISYNSRFAPIGLGNVVDYISIILFLVHYNL